MTGRAGLLALFALLAVALACSNGSSTSNADCFGGCICYRSESACKSVGCPWSEDAGCYNGLLPIDGGGD